MTKLKNTLKHSKNKIERFILFLVFISAIIIGIETTSFYTAYQTQFQFVDILILSIFVIEVILQLFFIYDKPLDYFKSAWNIFDVIIILVCILPYISNQTDNHSFAVLRIFRLGRTFRVFRVFRMVARLEPLKILIETLIKSIPALSYVSVLLCIIFYVYGIIGFNLFKDIDPVHFGSLFSSIFTLFKVVTGGENWSVLLEIQSKSMQYTPMIYFISFFIIAGLIMINLFVAVIVSELSAVAHLESKKTEMSNNELYHNLENLFNSIKQKENV